MSRSKPWTSSPPLTWELRENVQTGRWWGGAGGEESSFGSHIKPGAEYSHPPLGSQGPRPRLRHQDPSWDPRERPAPSLRAPRPVKAQLKSGVTFPLQLGNYVLIRSRPPGVGTLALQRSPRGPLPALGTVEAVSGE